MTGSLWFWTRLSCGITDVTAFPVAFFSVYVCVDLEVRLQLCVFYVKIGVEHVEIFVRTLNEISFSCGARRAKRSFQD